MALLVDITLYTSLRFGEAVTACTVSDQSVWVTFIKQIKNLCVICKKNSNFRFPGAHLLPVSALW